MGFEAFTVSRTAMAGVKDGNERLSLAGVGQIGRRWKLGGKKWPLVGSGEFYELLSLPTVEREDREASGSWAKREGRLRFVAHAQR